MTIFLGDTYIIYVPGHELWPLHLTHLVNVKYKLYIIDCYVKKPYTRRDLVGHI